VPMLETRTCLHCGGSMVVRTTSTTRYCSRDCWLRSEAHREQQSERMIARYRRTKDGLLKRPPGDPTPEQIRYLCTVIQEGWTDDDWRERLIAPRTESPRVYPASLFASAGHVRDD